MNLEDLVTHLKRTYGELQRKTEKEIMKMVKWQVDRIVQDVTETNIIKTIFKKRDFDKQLFDEFTLNGEKKKRDVKQEEKYIAEAESSGGDSLREYPKFKQSNSMNNMIPSVKSANDEAV